MTKQTITDYLDKFDYKYIEQNEKIIVKLDFFLQIIIDLSDSGKVKIRDKLTRLNLLTFPFSKSIKGSFVSNCIWALIVMLLFIGLRDSYNNFVLTILFLTAIYYNLCWLIYYLVKAEKTTNVK